jgi:hypothetical protein
MITKQIIHNSKGAAEAEVTSLNAKCKHVYPAGVANYNSVVKHPTQNKWATRYLIPEIGDTPFIKNLWVIIEEHLNPNQLGNLVDIAEDWKNTEI